MKLRIFLFIVFTALLTACETGDGTQDKETKSIINGEDFTPAENSTKIAQNKLVILFREGSKALEIVANDTLPGTYDVVTENLKSSSFIANIEYTDGTEVYHGISGTVELEKSDNMFSGSYTATLKSDNNDTEIEISSGSFSPIEATIELLLTTETAIHDELLVCYSMLKEYIQF